MLERKPESALEKVSDLFQKNRSEVQPSKGECIKDVYKFLQKCQEIKDFDPSKCEVYIISKQGTAPLERKRRNFFDFFQTQPMFHVFPIYEGIVFDYWLNFKGSLQEYLQKFSINHSIEVFTFDQYIKWNEQPQVTHRSEKIVNCSDLIKDLKDLESNARSRLILKK